MRADANRVDKDADAFAEFIRKKRERFQSKRKEAKRRMAIDRCLPIIEMLNWLMVS